MKLPRQCAILVGGLGTRLGSLTADTPKPLLDCGGRPFLAWVLRELCRFGIERAVLLAGYKSERVDAFCREVQASLPKPMSITISTEPRPAGTGGALWQAKDLLDETFLLINGDSWLDTNLARFFAAAGRAEHASGMALLRKMDDCSRYGTVELANGTITAFGEKKSAPVPGIINGGIYLFDGAVFSFLSPQCSLETDVLPAMAAKGVLGGMLADGYFIDIGIPADYARARTELPARLRRPAVFFDRDGVLNEDYGWVWRKEDFRWVKGAREAIRRVNDAGYHAFIVTNQAGVAKALYKETDVAVLHAFLCDEARHFGAVIDDIRYCPFHPAATVPEYRKDSGWRKPAPGMLLDLIEKWDVDVAGSLLIGDKDSDLQAAAAANIRGWRFEGGNLDEFVSRQERFTKSGVASDSVATVLDKKRNKTKS
jgi:D,D-heptose 1,7-bisphosphate phosphatase